MSGTGMYSRLEEDGDVTTDELADGDAGRQQQQQQQVTATATPRRLRPLSHGVAMVRLSMEDGDGNGDDGSDDVDPQEQAATSSLWKPLQWAASLFAGCCGGSEGGTEDGRSPGWRPFTRSTSGDVTEVVEEPVFNVADLQRLGRVDKVNLMCPQQGIVVGACEAQGLRPSMEDAMVVTQDLFAVFDGHGGEMAAILCAHLLERCFHESMADPLLAGNVRDVMLDTFDAMERQIELLGLRSGTTAVVCFRDESHCLHFAHAGDSRAVMFTRQEQVVRLTEDHKPNLERERLRVEAAGGWVTRQSFFSPVYRVAGVLAVSRALGDVWLRDFGVTHVPDVREEAVCLADEAVQFVIIACDGVWDRLTDEQACTIVGAALREHKHPQAAAEALRDSALVAGSTDNVSVIVLQMVPFTDVEPGPSSVSTTRAVPDEGTSDSGDDVT